MFVPSHRKQDSSISDAWREKGSGRVEEDEYARTTVEGGSDTESRCRFTLGEDTYAYNARGAAGKEMMGGGGVGGMPPVTPKGAQGWEKEGGRRKKNVRMLWCLLVLAVVAIAIGVGVGVSRRNRDESSDPAQGVSASNSIPSSIVPSSATVDPRSTATVPLTTPSGTSLATSTLATPTTYSTSYAFASGSFTTTVPLTYTIPTSYDTRGNGQLQFTQEVVLPSLGAGARGSFTSELRFRVAQTQGPGVSRMRGKRHLKGRELRVSGFSVGRKARRCLKLTISFACSDCRRYETDEGARCTYLYHPRTPRRHCT